MDSAALLHVFIGPSPVLAAEPPATLIIEAGSDRLDALRQRLAPLPQADVLAFHHAALGATSQAELSWFRFNDSRFDGPVPLERWQAFYPNLQLQQQETIQSQTLAEILAQWPAAAIGEQGINLIISQGNPVDILKGADVWLPRLHRIEVQGPKAYELWFEACQHWLEPQGFMRENETDLSWTLDGQALKLIQQQAEIESLRQTISAIQPILQEQERATKEIPDPSAMQALSVVFPYAAYRRKRPDLKQYSDPDLLAHFITHGMNEGVNLDFSSLEHEWQAERPDATKEVSFLSLLKADSTSSEPVSKLNNPEPTRPVISPHEGTGIGAWLLGSHLYVSLPEEMASVTIPSVLQGSHGFPLQRDSWTPAIINLLTCHQTIHLFSPQNRSKLRVLSELKHPSVLDAGINQISYCSVLGGQTFHVHLGEMAQDVDVLLFDEFEFLSPGRENWLFEALIAVHRASGSLELIVTQEGKTKRFNVEFDSQLSGGTAPVNYLPVLFEFPLDEGVVGLTLTIKHSSFVEDIQGHKDSYYFVANPLLRSCGSVDADQPTLVPRLLVPDKEINTNDVLFKSTVMPFVSAEDQPFVLSLGNGKFHELFQPLMRSLTLKADYSHTLIFAAEPAGDFSLFINNSFSALLAIRGDDTPVQLPLEWLRGESVRLEIRDLSGSQILFHHAVLAPRFLTPVDLLLQESKPPFPTDLTVRANHRYQALRNHLRQPIEGLKTEMLISALQTLDQNHETLKLHSLEFPVFADPIVSIIIPAHNKIEITFYALCALLLSHNSVSYEVILVDDGSTDETAEIETWVTGVRVLHNEQPQRFIKACNKGVSEARGKYVVLLNNDTEVTTGWLDTLIDAFERFENVGAVGSKLLYPDGRLQDAGGIIWGTGNPWNYGHGKNPWDPRFCYARQVDYLSGAALMTTKAIWDEVGGLSHYLEPMYFEDTDFSFKVRDAGYKTYFVPSSIVYHFEGATSGTDTSQGFKKFQEINRPKFKRCWAKAFARHGEEGVQPDLEKDRGITGRVLFIDYTTPREDKDAGSYAAIREIELVQSLGYKVTFLPQNLGYFGSYTEELMKNGVEVITAPFYLSLASFLSDRAKEFDAAYITRYYVAADSVHLIREHSPKTRILLNNADLHFLRELRAALIDNDPNRLEVMRQVRHQELEMMRQVDLVLSYNEIEHAVISSHTDGQVKVMTCPWVVDIPALVNPLSERKGLSFLGNFKHPPNGEGIQWFCRNVMPMLVSEDILLTIYGSGMGEDIEELKSDWIKPVGYVENVSSVYQNHRVFIAPLLSGAGMKGKVVSALAYGIPTVLSPTAAEGIGLRHGYDCVIAEKPEEWMAAIIQLCTDDELWTAISVASQNYAANQFSFAAGKQKMKRAFEAVDLYNHTED